MNRSRTWLGRNGVPDRQRTEEQDEPDAVDSWVFENEPFSGSLNPLETLSIAWRSIIANLTRSILTTLGVIIGVAAVVALTAVGAGVTGNVTENLTALGSNLLTVSSNATMAGGTRVQMGGRQTVTLADAEAIRDLDDPRVAGVAPTLQTGSQIRAGTLNANATVVGTWPDYASIRNSEPDVGSFFTEADVASRRNVVVLGYDIAADLFPYGGALGQTVRINNQSYSVVGVLPDKGNTGFQSPNRQVFVPLSTYMQRVARQAAVGVQTVQSIIVQGANASELSALEADLTALLAELRNAYDPQSYDFRIQNQADTLASFNAISTTLTLFLGSIAGISLLVGGIGIMNIMLVSVTERTREIGIRKALGAKPHDILSQFLLEAVVLSAGGGVIGMLFGVGGAFLVGPLVGIEPAITPVPIVIAFLFSLAVGVFFGFYPAKRAARLDPVESLRYE